MVAHYGCILRWDYIRTELKKDFFVKLERNKIKKLQTMAKCQWFVKRETSLQLRLYLEHLYLHEGLNHLLVHPIQYTLL